MFSAQAIKIKKLFLNLFFPKKCLGCNHPDTYLCRDCFNKIEINLNIEKNTYLDKIISITSYKNPIVRELIKNFKYNYIRELAKPLSKLLINNLENISNISNTSNISNIAIVPIPLHKRRKRSRGYNQAELLAKEIAKHFNLPLEKNILKRIISTEPQANIKHDIQKRIQNIKGVFAISPESVEEKTIILIDDVSTTNATLTEAGKILKKNGAKQIWGLVVAKG